VTLTQDEAFARIRLLRSPNVGPVSYAQLLRRFGNAQAAIEALPDLASRGGRDYRPAKRERIEDEVASARKAGARYLFHDSPDYPGLLGEIEGAPPILIVRGDSSLASRPCVAMVGARNASAAACRFARGLAHDLGQQGMVVVSGLARGIDSAAHDGALDTGTIGIIAGGIDIFYPPENRQRQEAMYERGLVLAEMPLGTEPRARQRARPFPPRQGAGRA
jgi:DNA processing protein